MDTPPIPHNFPTPPHTSHRTVSQRTAYHSISNHGCIPTYRPNTHPHRHTAHRHTDIPTYQRRQQRRYENPVTFVPTLAKLLQITRTPKRGYKKQGEIAPTLAKLIQITGIPKRRYIKPRKNVPTLAKTLQTTIILKHRYEKPVEIAPRRHLHPQDMGTGRSRIPFTDPSPLLLLGPFTTLHSPLPLLHVASRSPFTTTSPLIRIP